MEKLPINCKPFLKNMCQNIAIIQSVGNSVKHLFYIAKIAKTYI